MTNRSRGQLAEQLACEFLQAKGLQLIARNYYSRRGEIDLIMQHASTIVFIEVKARQNSDYGTATETVTPRKQSRIIATAQSYIQQYNIQKCCRFDVVAVKFTPTADAQISDWIQDAFQASSYF